MCFLTIWRATRLLMSGKKLNQTLGNNIDDSLSTFTRFQNGDSIGSSKSLSFSTPIDIVEFIDKFRWPRARALLAFNQYKQKKKH